MLASSLPLSLPYARRFFISAFERTTAFASLLPSLRANFSRARSTVETYVEMKLRPRFFTTLFSRVLGEGGINTGRKIKVGEVGEGDHVCDAAKGERGGEGIPRLYDNNGR